MSTADISRQARRWYAEQLAGAAGGWWDVVIITASSGRQADRYEWEIQRRRERGQLPASARFVVAPDPGDRRVGSGGATIHALQAIGAQGVEWWRQHRVLMIHSGGDSRRLPQYSLSGKLFSALPGNTSVFDEMLALSTAWARETTAGLVVGSGDVVLTFDAEQLRWDRAGVCGVAMRQPAATAMQHGVYVADEQGRVYSFLQKPTREALCAAGALLDGDQAALDIGLLHFSPEPAARLAAIELGEDAPLIDLYQHVTGALTGALRADTAGPLQKVTRALADMPFWCSLVDGEFLHIGTTTLFRELLTGAWTESGTRPITGTQSGVAVDCVLGRGVTPGPGALLIECNLSGSIEAGRGSVVHGLEGISSPVEIPEDTVVHQVPVAVGGDGRRGVVVRVYGVSDDPKTQASAWKATWFGRPMIDELRGLGLDLAKVWPGLAADQWTLWNAQLFPVCGSADEAWACAKWMLHMRGGEYSADQWDGAERLSLETSAQWSDVREIEAAYTRRLQSHWCATAVALAESGSDVRPLLAHSPGMGPLAEVGRRLRVSGAEQEERGPSEAASRYFQAGLFLQQAGLEVDAAATRDSAFRMVERAVGSGSLPRGEVGTGRWAREQVIVEAPVRIDLGGGWSDTPPFCLDWGGTVLNLGIKLGGLYPIRTEVRQIPEQLIRCIAGDSSQEYSHWAEVCRDSGPGDPFLLVRTALRMMFSELRGGIEISMKVDVPMGSGLGTSSILAATVIRALAEMSGERVEGQELSDRSMRLEQLMTTGGGWQDQAGGIYPGAKIVSSGPGSRQRLRVQPVAWSRAREAEFESLMVLYYTGIRRIAKGLLQQVVGRYLARETATVQVLHSLKTLAMEMSYAMQEGDWDYLGHLLDRHWELNQVLDPNTTNAPIHSLLGLVRPYLRGAKLAGAGGGGFMMLLARSPEAAEELREVLGERSREQGGAVYDWRIARSGLGVCEGGLAAAGD
jgi:fucokinase